MLFISRFTAQPLAQSISHLLGCFSWDSLAQQANNWYQPIAKWLQPEEPTFYRKAGEEEGFIQHQAWRSAFKGQLRVLQQQIIQAYQQGHLLLPDKLRETLIAEQASFTSKAVSALFYDRSLRRLAQRFPQYAYALEGACHHFKENLKVHPQKALRYFYNDIVNSIILWSGHKLALSELIQTLAYYQALVPTHLYGQVQTLLQRVKGLELEPTNKTVGHLLQQINQELTVKEEASAKSTSEASSLLPTTMQRFIAGTQAIFKQGWTYIQQHPKATMASLAATTLAGYKATADYPLNDMQSINNFNFNTHASFTQANLTGSATSWLNTFQSLTALSPLTTLSALPLAVSYVTLSYSSHPHQGIPVLQAVLPLITSWLSELALVSAQGAWIRGLGGIRYDVGNSVQQTSDGGYIVTGSTQSFGGVVGICGCPNGQRTALSVGCKR